MELRKYLKVMVKHDGSDLYLTTDAPPLMKINEKMVAVGKHILQPGETRKLASSLMNEVEQKEFAKKLEMNLGHQEEGVGRFRVNIFQQRSEVGMVLRRIKDEIPTCKELNLPSVLKELIMKKQGLIIVVGGTGCGKSTSLAALIDYRNRKSVGHIITIEDPIEYVYKHRRSIITQREVGADTLSYEEALKNTLRQSPSVILIGEIRDAFTMQKALQFAETGHLCVATLHANNANQALERVINFFPEEEHKRVRLDMALNLRAILSQRLLAAKEGGRRVAAFEILIATARVKDMIMQGQFHEIKEVMSSENNVGMISFDNYIYKLYKDGYITKKEALHNADSDTDMQVKMDMQSGNIVDRGDSITIDNDADSKLK
jgi:twitching motility protein PilU